MSHPSLRGAHRPGILDLAAGQYRISDAEFHQFQELVERETGIQLPESKRPLLVGRLARRLRELNLATFGEYYRRVTEGADGSERIRMIDRISTNETYFFREPRQFDFLEREILPAWAAQPVEQGRRVRVWSAACSTGEEPFSVAMTLLAQLPGWEIDVFGSDLSTSVLEKAKAAVWPIEKSRDIPERHLKAYMLRGVGAQQGYLKATPELRSLVTFGRQNLHEPRYAVGGPFDLIFCRNVLIYFAAEGRAAVVSRLVQHLAPGGYLFLGHAETLNGITDRLRSVGPTVYRWTEAAPSRSARPGSDGRRSG